MKLGERIRELITEKNISQDWVANEVGMTPAALSNILTGKTTDPSFFTVFAIARALNEPLSAITNDSPLIWLSAEIDRLTNAAETIIDKITLPERPHDVVEIPPRRKRGSTVAARAVRTKHVHIRSGVVESKKPIPKQYKGDADAAFQVIGDAMAGANIHPGDLLYVKRTSRIDAAVGKIVVFSYRGDLMVRRLAVRGNHLLLRSPSHRHPMHVVDEKSNGFELIGIVVAVKRRDS